MTLVPPNRPRATSANLSRAEKRPAGREKHRLGQVVLGRRDNHLRSRSCRTVRYLAHLGYVERDAVGNRERLTTEEWLGCVGKGWHGLVRPLIEEADRQNATILQIKEKFGGLRFYFQCADGVSDEDAGRLNDMVDAAEAASVKTCETCGKPGKQRGGGWILTLCDEHHEERERQLAERRRAH